MKLSVVALCWIGALMGATLCAADDELRGSSKDYEKEISSIPGVLAELQPSTTSTDSYPSPIRIIAQPDSSTKENENEPGSTTTESFTSDKEGEARLGRVLARTTKSLLEARGGLLEARGGSFQDKLSSGENIPAQVTSPLTPDVVIALSRKIQLCCTAVGTPDPTIEWLKDGEPFQPTPYLGVTDGCLMSKEFTDRENGYFQCRASNEFGVSLSQVKYVAAEKMPVGEITSTTVFTLTAGQAFSLQFGDVPETLPRALRRWYSYNKNEQLTFDERMSLDLEGNLHFAYVVQSDSKEYKAGLVRAGQINLYGRGEIVVTEDIRDKPDRRPEIQAITREVKATMYESVSLECIFSGKPVPLVSWRNRSHYEITPSAKHSLGQHGRLTIHDVRQSDNGTYTCVGSNSKETVNEVVHVTVVAPPLPVKDRTLSPTTVPDQGNVTLYCKTYTAEGMSNEPPVWYRNGELFTEATRFDAERYSFSVDYTELTITHLNKQVDTAGYQCNTTNAEGYLFMDGYLRVINSIEITKSPGVDVIVVDPAEMTIVELTVLARGDVCCALDYYWTVNGTQADFSAQPFIYDSALNRLLLNVSSVSKEDLYSSMGYYNCRVSNNFDVVNVRFILQIPGSQKQVAADSGFAMWWLGIIFGILAILIVVVIIIVLLKSNYPRSTYMLEKTELKHNLNPQEDLLNQSFQEI